MSPPIPFHPIAPLKWALLIYGYSRFEPSNGGKCKVVAYGGSEERLAALVEALPAGWETGADE
jgi:hypothetical protein